MVYMIRILIGRLIFSLVRILKKRMAGILRQRIKRNIKTKDWGNKKEVQSLLIKLISRLNIKKLKDWFSGQRHAI